MMMPPEKQPEGPTAGLLVPKALYLTFSMMSGSAPVLLPLYLKDVLSLTLIQIKDTMLVTPICAFIGGTAWTTLSDRPGWFRPIFFFCLIGSTILNLAFGLDALKQTPVGSSERYWICLALLGGVAFTVSGIGPLMDAYVARYLGEGRQHLYGEQRVFATIGQASSTFITGVWVDNVWHGSLDGMWSLYATFGVMTIAVCLVAPWDFLSVKPVDTESREDVGAAKGKTKGLLDTLRSPVVALSLFLSFVFFTSRVLLQTVVNFFLTSDLNASKTLLGLLGPISVLLEVPLFFLSSRVISRVGTSMTLFIGIVTQLARALVYVAVSEAVANGGGFLADAKWILAADVLQGGSFALFWSALFGHVSERTPESVKGTMVGILNAVSFGVASVVGSYLGTDLYARYGASAVFYLSVACAAVSVPVWAVWNRSRKWVSRSPRPETPSDDEEEEEEESEQLIRAYGGESPQSVVVTLPNQDTRHRSGGSGSHGRRFD